MSTATSRRTRRTGSAPKSDTAAAAARLFSNDHEMAKAAYDELVGRPVDAQAIPAIEAAFAATAEDKRISAFRALCAMFRVLADIEEAAGLASKVARFFLVHGAEAMAGERMLFPDDEFGPTRLEHAFKACFDRVGYQAAVLFRELQNGIKKSACFVRAEDVPDSKLGDDPVVLTIAWSGHLSFGLIKALLDSGQAKHHALILGLGMVNGPFADQGVLSEFFHIEKRLHVVEAAKGGSQSAIKCCLLFHHGWAVYALQGVIQEVLRQPEVRRADDLYTAVSLFEFVPSYQRPGWKNRLKDAAEGLVARARLLFIRRLPWFWCRETREHLNTCLRAQGWLSEVAIDRRLSPFLREHARRVLRTRRRMARFGMYVDTGVRKRYSLSAQ